MDLSTYVRVGRYDLPEPTRTTTGPAGNLLGQEASAVTYNWDTDTLFITGDGGTSITEVSKTGQLVSTMTLATGDSPQGTEFYDPEGLTYIGDGQFVMTEERDRNAVLFTYEANTTLGRDDAQTVTLGTNVGNVGLEGVTYDPLTGGFIFVKESGPIGVFQTDIDFDAGTATNGSPTTVNSTNLFDPTTLGVLDLADVFAFSNLPEFDGTPEEGNLLLLSQESGKILEVTRDGTIVSTLTIVSDPGNPLDVVNQQHEGITVDRDGNIYVVSENGGGDFDHPQLWVYAPSAVANAAPTAIALTNAVTSLEENTSTTVRVKVANIAITDDGLGTNTLSLSGADAALFEVDSTGLYIKAGTVLDFETKSSFAVTVRVDDTTVGATPDATVNYTLTLTDVQNESQVPALYISEVAPWSSGNSPVAADWFEVTNSGSSAIDITGWKFDDSSASFASAVALSGITSIAPGESVIFLETADLAATKQLFIDTWFGGNAPAGLQIGSYTGGGVGLSTGGDSVVLFNAAGEKQAAVSFDASPANAPFTTFNNAEGLNDAQISTPSAVGVNGAIAAAEDADEIGSPGTVGRLFISEVAPWSSGDSPVGADWFEVTNSTAFAVDITGWKMDDSSGSPAAAVALSGITSIAAGESVIFLETADLAAAKQAFIDTWFGGKAPEGLQFGAYTGGGVGLSTDGDAVNLYDAANRLQASVTFGASPENAPFTTFENAGGLNGTAITATSTPGVNGAFGATTDPNEIGSPGGIVAPEVEDGGRLITPNGYVGTIGGSGLIFGTQGFQDITVLTEPGTITFDASFNRGGDIIRLQGDADEYTIALSGSSAVLTHGQTTITLPIGLGTALVFDDGVRKLAYDIVSSSAKIGAQTLTDDAAQVTAVTDGTTLPTGADPAARAVLALTEGSDVITAGNVNVFGANGNETVHLLGGSATFDASFNRGGDVIALSGDADDYKAFRSGSNVTLLIGNDTIVIPVGEVGLTLDFAGDDRTLVFDAGANALKIDGQTISATTAGTAVTLTPLAMGLLSDDTSAFMLG